MPEIAAAASNREQESETMPTMGFLDHLEELRTRIVRSIVAVAVGAASGPQGTTGSQAVLDCPTRA